MYKKIVVPLDGSRIAENALPYARALARGLKVPVELLCVIDLADVERHVSVPRDYFSTHWRKMRHAACVTI